MPGDENNSTFNVQKLRRISATFWPFALFFLYNYYSTGKFIDARAQQWFGAGLGRWLIYITMALILIVTVLLSRIVIRSSCSTRKKLGYLLILLAGLLQVFQGGTLLVAGSFNISLSLVICYVVLLGLAGGYLMTK